MPALKASQEIEIKLRVTDFPALHRRLKQISAQEASPRTHESNTLYDSAKRLLARRGQLIRIRTEQPSPKSSRKDQPLPARTILTFKVPPKAKFRVLPAIRSPKT